MLHTHFRDCQEWRHSKLPLSTSNNETAKLYDATLTQYVGWYDDPKYGGIEGTVEKMIASDPEFVMGHVMSIGLDLMGTGRSPALDPAFKTSLDTMLALASSEDRQITGREQLHVKAINEFFNGNMNSACVVWEDILFKHPTDMLALKFAHDTYFYLGNQGQMRTSVHRVLRSWPRQTPLYGYLKGMLAFGMVECEYYEAAEPVAKEGLDLNPLDAWSTHAMAHVLEMTCRYKKGIAFLSSTVKEWSQCGMLACHNYWHWALYHLEKGEIKGALDIYDSEVASRSYKSDAMLDLVDACSLLLRIEMEGGDVGSRWSDLLEFCRPHLDDHLTVFNDVHLLMACAGAKQTEVTEKLMQSVHEYTQSGSGDQCAIMRQDGEALMTAVQAYIEGDYAGCVDALKPIRFNIIKIGGSNAQRDIFNLLLISAALKSHREEHNTYARHLLFERKALRTDSPMADRLMAKALSKHEAS